MAHKPSSWLGILVLLAAAACSSQSGQRTTLTSIPAPSLQGSLFENAPEQPALIYLPPSYDKGSGAFPVVYYLPGFTTDVTEYVDGSIDGLDMGECMDGLIASGAVGETIVVIVNGRNVLGGSFYTNSPLTGRWEDFVVTDVVAYVDRTFRTIREPLARGIVGDSMGGFGAIHAAMRHPDVFGCVYAISPGLAAPGGVQQSPMLAPDKVDAYFLAEPMLRGLAAEEAERQFRELIQELYASNSRFNYYRAMGYAYGAAFAFDLSAPVPHVDFPYEKSEGAIVEKPESMRRYEAGFGDLAEKVRAYEANLRRLRGIAVDYGKNDRSRWIVEGCEYFAGLLRQAGIPVEVRAHDGGHWDRLRESIESHALPFISKHLTPATAARNSAQMLLLRTSVAALSECTPSRGMGVPHRQEELS